MLAHDQAGRGLTNRFRGHDFISLAVLQHAVLVNAAFMRKGILADNRLIVLNRKPGNGRDIAAGAGDMGRVDRGLIRQAISPHLERHDDFFQRGITGPLAQAIDGAFDLARTALDACQAIGHGQAQIIMAMG